MTDRLKPYLAMSAEALSAPLWTFPPLDAVLVQRARRRVLGDDPETMPAALRELRESADERVTEFAPTE
ncbi:hypothetical protein ACWCQZ_39180 [Streptomyces sp. NPDC002285]